MGWVGAEFFIGLTLPERWGGGHPLWHEAWGVVNGTAAQKPSSLLAFSPQESLLRLRSCFWETVDNNQTCNQEGDTFTY